jgi:hypothetical protein
MGYEEEIFDRKETEVKELRTYDNILGWLLQDSSGNMVRRQTRVIRDIAKNLAKPFELAEEAERAETYEELTRLESQANNLSFDANGYAQDVIKNKIKDFEGLGLIEEQLQEKIRTAQLDIKDFEEKRKKEVREEIEDERDKLYDELKDLPEDEIDYERDKIDKRISYLEDRRRIDIEKETNIRIREVLDAKREFEEIKRTSKDKRKIKNAKRNLKKLDDRLKNLK